MLVKGECEVLPMPFCHGQAQSLHCSDDHVACLAHFGPTHCQACHLLFLALQVATAAALPRDPGDAAKSTEFIFGDEMWQAAHKLRGYAGVAFLSPEGPMINEVRFSFQAR